MSDFMSTDLSSVLSAGNAGIKNVNIVKKGSNLDLDMTDFVTLMITQMTNQGIDETVDTSDMLNQMIQMQLVTALANMTDATVMGYAASLVGKEVTVAQYDSDGNLQELVGTVTGTGTMDGNQVIFLDNDKYYQMSEIMAVGRLPAKAEEPDESGEAESSGTSGTTGTTGTTGGTTSTGQAENTDRTEGEETETDTDTEIPAGQSLVAPPPTVSGVEDEYHGESGAPTE